MVKLPPVIIQSDESERLPQPLRMFRKLLAGMVESALQMCELRQQERDIAASMYVQQELLPDGLLELQSACQDFVPVIACHEGREETPSPFVVGATGEGQLCSLQLGPGGQCQCQIWDNMPTATVLDAFCHPMHGYTLLAAAGPAKDDPSSTVVSVHRLGSGDSRQQENVGTSLDSARRDGSRTCINSGSMLTPQPLAQTTMAGSVAALRLAPDGSMLAASSANGDLIVFRVPVPAESTDTADASSSMPLQAVLHVEASEVAGQVGGVSFGGPPQSSWQQTPSNVAGRRQACLKGMYVWCPGHNHLLLFRLQAASPASTAAAVQPPAGTWTLPHAIACGACSADGRLLAFGLANGSVLLWDDRLGGHRAVLPRVPSAPTCLAFVGHSSSHLLTATAAGKLYTLDLRSAAPAQAPWELSQLLSVQEALCPFADSRVLLACSSAVPAAPAPGLPGWARTGVLPQESVPGKGPPRLLWVDVEQGTMVAELQAPSGCYFCLQSEANGSDSVGAAMQQGRRLSLAHSGNMLIVGAQRLPAPKLPVAGQANTPSGPISWPSLLDRQPATASANEGGAADATPAPQQAQPEGAEPAAAAGSSETVAACPEQGGSPAAPAEPIMLLLFDLVRMRRSMGSDPTPAADGQAPPTAAWAATHATTADAPSARPSHTVQHASSQQQPRGSGTNASIAGVAGDAAVQAASADDGVAAALARVAARLNAAERRQREHRVRAGLKQLLQQLEAEASSANPPMLLAR